MCWNSYHVSKAFTVLIENGVKHKVSLFEIALEKKETRHDRAYLDGDIRDSDICYDCTLLIWSTILLYIF